MQTILITAAIVTTIVVSLSMLVLGARRWLMPDGEATINVNDRRTLIAPLGEKLLWALAGDGILLPAACGGRGACGQCRVKITAGAQPLLPTESEHINRRDANDGVRLACVTTLRSDLKIRLPDAALDAQQLTCTVVSNHNVTTFLKELVLSLPPGEAFSYRAGDYVTLEAPPGRNRFSDFDIDGCYSDEWDRLGLLSLEAKRDETETRAYSIASAPLETGLLRLIVRIATPPASARRGAPPGKVSSYIFGLDEGDTVRVSGPFGDFHAPASESELILIGGGAGIAPLRSIVHDQLRGRQTLRRISLWYGARNTAEICLQDEFDALAEAHPNFSLHVALSDARLPESWHGPRGYIHSVVYEQYLAAHPTPEDADYLICGPPLMSGAVIALLEDLGVNEDRIFYDDFGG